MPLYIDHHKHVEGLTADAVADAHAKDLEAQEKYGVNYIKYWFNEEKGEVFCLSKHRARKQLTPSTRRPTASGRMR